tara:strand:+ start:10604 stop:10858 length:255 start_codon:yes stop_codon:yes gene_type:complete
MPKIVKKTMTKEGVVNYCSDLGHLHVAMKDLIRNLDRKGIDSLEVVNATIGVKGLKDAGKFIAAMQSNYYEQTEPDKKNNYSIS